MYPNRQKHIQCIHIHRYVAHIHTYTLTIQKRGMGFSLDFRELSVRREKYTHFVTFSVDAADSVKFLEGTQTRTQFILSTLLQTIFLLFCAQNIVLTIAGKEIVIQIQ